MPNRTYIVFFIVIFFSAQSLKAQNETYTVEHYGIKNGLSQNYVNCVFQDAFGYIWVGTQDGLNKFDGYSFKVYKQDPNNKHSISHNFITGITASKDSSLWIVTNDGLEKYDHRSNLFQNILKNRPVKQSVYSTKIKSVYEDDENILWIRTIDGIIQYYIEKNEFSEYQHKRNEIGYISDYNYFSIIEDSHNQLWTGCKKDLLKFDKTKKQFEKVLFNLENTYEVFTIFPHTEIEYIIGTDRAVIKYNVNTGEAKIIDSNRAISKAKSILKDTYGTLWVATEYGLFYMKKNMDKLSYFDLNQYVTDQVSVANVSSVFQDKSHIIWVGTDYGLFKIDPKKKPFNLYRKDKNNKTAFSSNTIYSICHDEETDLLWLGTRGYGLNIFDRKTNTVRVFNKKNSSLNSNSIFCIEPDNKGNIWLGTSNGPYIYKKAQNHFYSISDFLKKDYQENFTNNRTTDFLFEDDAIWIATLNGLFIYKDNKLIKYAKGSIQNSLISNDVFKIVKQFENTYWIATLNGLSKLNTADETFTNYTNEDEQISNNSVLTVFKSRDETIWLGTGTGLNKYLPEKDSFKYYTSQSHGFKNDFIYTIAEDKDKNLWLSTNRGITMFNPYNETVLNFGEEDNLQGYEYNIGAVYQNSKGELFWGGSGGLNSLNPDDISQEYFSSKPVITSIYISTTEGKREINSTNLKAIDLTHNESSFDITFALPEYTNPKKNRFRYRILESDEEWIDIGTTNSINFYQLAPGVYTFQLIASSTNNIWNTDPVSLTIKISSPWWETTTAYIIYILILIVLTSTGILIYNKEIRKENRILNEKQIVARKVEKQKELLAIKNNNIAESMRYASGIINALLPDETQIKKLLPDSFVLFMSKEIVSGDFYWVDETDEKIFAAAVDCTGHGIPGAFMSIIGLDLLRNILEAGIDSPGEILDELIKGIASVFKKDDSTKEMKDGMDLSIIAIHKGKNLIEYAGAINQIYIIRDDTILEYKGDRFSVSPSNYNLFGSFTNHTIQVRENDMIYLFSDGYVDQFGGPDEKKFKYRRFRHMLLSNYEKPVNEQKNILSRVINTWRGRVEQIDDILVMGIRFHENRN